MAQCDGFPGGKVQRTQRCRKVIMCLCVCVWGGAMSLEREGECFFLERKSERQYQVAQESQGAETSQCLKASEARVARTDGFL